jgi:hypothetical protein
MIPASVQTAAEDFSSRDEPATVAPKLPHTREGAPFRVLNLHTLHDFAGNPLVQEAAQVLFQRGRRQDRAPPDVNCFLTTHYRQAKGDSQNLFNIATRVAGRQSRERRSPVFGLAGRCRVGIAFIIRCTSRLNDAACNFSGRQRSLCGRAVAIASTQTPHRRLASRRCLPEPAVRHNESGEIRNCPACRNQSQNLH